MVFVSAFGSGCAQKDETARSSSEAVLSPTDSGRIPALELEVVSDQPTVQGSSPVYVNAAMQPLHDRNERDFLQAVGLGIGRRAHIQILHDQILAMEDGSEWRIYKSELLGIAEHDQPMVMSTTRAVSAGHSLARMEESAREKEEIESAKTYAESARKGVRERALNDFEIIALERMKSGETGPWMAEAPDRGVGCFRMMGAIRARQDCLKCHSDYKEGDALGAFVYLLEQVAPAKVEIEEPELLSSR